MKKNSSKPDPETPAFPKTMHTVRVRQDRVLPHPKKQRDNIFSKSKDLREDRGTREIKTSHNDLSFHAQHL